MAQGPLDWLERSEKPGWLGKQAIRYVGANSKFLLFFLFSSHDQNDDILFCFSFRKEKGKGQFAPPSFPKDSVSVHRLLLSLGDFLALRKEFHFIFPVILEKSRFLLEGLRKSLFMCS